VARHGAPTKEDACCVALFELARLHPRGRTGPTSREANH
jgi:hypothetical protein